MGMTRREIAAKLDRIVAFAGHRRVPRRAREVVLLGHVCPARVRHRRAPRPGRAARGRGPRGGRRGVPGAVLRPHRRAAACGHDDGVHLARPRVGRAAVRPRRAARSRPAGRPRRGAPHRRGVRTAGRDRFARGAGDGGGARTGGDPRRHVSRAGRARSARRVRRRAPHRPRRMPGRPPARGLPRPLLLHVPRRRPPVPVPRGRRADAALARPGPQRRSTSRCRNSRSGRGSTRSA